MIFSRVCKLFSDQAVTFPLGKRALFKQLKDEGVLVADGEGKTTKPKRLGNGVLRLLWLDRAKVDGVMTASAGVQMTMVPEDKDTDNPF